MKVLFIGLRAFRFTGDFKREVIEIRDRKRNFIENGEVLLANELQSLAFARSPHFEEVDLSQIIFAGETEDNEEELNLKNAIDNFAFVEGFGGESSKITVLPIEEFGDDRDALEEYGLSFGIDLNKAKTIENMYQDLLDYIEQQEPADEKSEDEEGYQLPFLEELESLTDEEVIKACDFINIKKGNKKIATLKELLAAHLPAAE